MERFASSARLPRLKSTFVLVRRSNPDPQLNFMAEDTTVVPSSSTETASCMAASPRLRQSGQRLQVVPYATIRLNQDIGRWPVFPADVNVCFGRLWDFGADVTERNSRFHTEGRFAPPAPHVKIPARGSGRTGTSPWVYAAFVLASRSRNAPFFVTTVDGAAGARPSAHTAGLGGCDRFGTVLHAGTSAPTVR